MLTGFSCSTITNTTCREHLDIQQGLVWNADKKSSPIIPRREPECAFREFHTASWHIFQHYGHSFCWLPVVVYASISGRVDTRMWCVVHVLCVQSWLPLVSHLVFLPHINYDNLYFPDSARFHSKTVTILALVLSTSTSNSKSNNTSAITQHKKSNQKERSEIDEREISSNSLISCSDTF